jgi:hypothetical protein
MTENAFFRVTQKSFIKYCESTLDNDGWGRQLYLTLLLCCDVAPVTEDEL